ncbi:MAG: hypothetical protein QOF42_47 [Gammaproteobacteria bacterium]|jgi:hypothetical protein|nr:hypothetical protein [Gammaproteobacteria bacterium]
MAGPAFARTKPTLAQVHTVVTKNMPLTAPGTLPAADYAAIMAYMLSYNCVKPSGTGKTPFPAGDISALPSPWEQPLFRLLDTVVGVAIGVGGKWIASFAFYKARGEPIQ